MTPDVSHLWTEAYSVKPSLRETYPPEKVDRLSVVETLDILTDNLTHAQLSGILHQLFGKN